MSTFTNHTKRAVNVIETEVYSRVVGYYRPVQNWNKGKRREFSQRSLMSTTAQESPARDLVSDVCIQSIA